MFAWQSSGSVSAKQLHFAYFSSVTITAISILFQQTSCSIFISVLWLILTIGLTIYILLFHMYQCYWSCATMLSLFSHFSLLRHTLVFLSCPFDPQRKSSPQALQLQSHIPVYYEACFTVQEINNSEKVKPYWTIFMRTILLISYRNHWKIKVHNTMVQRKESSPAQCRIS